MAFLFVWSMVWAAHGSTSFEARVQAIRTVELARQALALDELVPFDQAYGHDTLERRVARELREESLLAEHFGTRVSLEMLSAEFDRIERRTQDLEQWEGIKRALQRDRRLVEETVCRPLVVQRLLRQRFAFDEVIHADAHAKARVARRLFLDARPVEGVKRLPLARGATPPPDTRAWLAEAKAQAGQAQVLSSPEERPNATAEKLVSLHPEAVHALEAQLREPGDVSPILSEADRFSVYRLIERTENAWKVEAAIYPKRDFEEWFRETAGLTR